MSAEALTPEYVAALVARLERERDEARWDRDALRRVAEAAWRLSQYSYHDLAMAGGLDECKHGIAAGIHCQRCDELMVKGWKERGG